MSEWQPIETAPKDGTWILLFTPRYSYPVKLGRWSDSWDEFQGVGMLPLNGVTHWMPLPKPPVSP